MVGRKTKTKIQPPTQGTFAVKRTSRARRIRRARQELCSYPTLHITFNKKRGTGHKEIRIPHPTGKPSLPQSKNGTQEDTLKRWRKLQTGGRPSAR